MNQCAPFAALTDPLGGGFLLSVAKIFATRRQGVGGLTVMVLVSKCHFGTSMLSIRDYVA